MVTKPPVETSRAASRKATTAGAAWAAAVGSIREAMPATLDLRASVTRIRLLPTALMAVPMGPTAHGSCSREEQQVPELELELELGLGLEDRRGRLVAVAGRRVRGPEMAAPQWG